VFQAAGQTKRTEIRSNADRWFFYSCIVALVLAMALVAGLLVKVTGIPDATAILTLG
jgi:hypothetical protein